jgi:hypothetical protein
MSGAFDPHVDPPPLSRIGEDSPEHRLVQFQGGAHPDGLSPPIHEAPKRCVMLKGLEDVRHRTIRHAPLFEHEPFHVRPGKGVPFNRVRTPRVESSGSFPDRLGKGIQRHAREEFFPQAHQYVFSHDYM